MDVPVLQIQKASQSQETLEYISKRILEQIVDVLVPHIMKDMVEVGGRKS